MQSYSRCSSTSFSVVYPLWRTESTTVSRSNGYTGKSTYSPTTYFITVAPIENSVSRHFDASWKGRCENGGTMGAFTEAWSLHVRG